MFLSKVPEHGVKNKLLVNLLSIFVLFIGIRTILNTQREVFPNVSMDVVVINTVYPGATSGEIETLVTNPIEDALDSLSDIKEISSISAEGYSNVTVLLEPDAPNKDKIINDLQQAVDRIDDFPSDLDQLPVVKEINTKDQPIIEIALSGNLERKELQEHGKNLESLLEEIPGVSDIARSGWKDAKIYVEANAKALKRYRISIDQISDVLKFHNINVPAGNLKGSDKEFLVRTDSKFYTLEEIENVIIRANPTGRYVKVKDVATVTNGFDDASSSVVLRPNGKEGFNLSVIKKESKDVIKLVEHVEKVIEDYRKIAPQELQLSTINDSSMWVKRRLGILVNNGALGLLFVLISLLIFLSPPVAFWTAIGLPVAAALGIWGMQFFGMSINMISMFALIMVMGMLVDDAIIVAENIYRRMEEGYSPKEAAIIGGTEVLKPVSTAILTSILVFLPLAFMTGIFGKFVFIMPVVVIVMLIASWIESLWILPAHLTEFESVTNLFLNRNKAPNLNAGRIRRFFKFIFSLPGRLIDFLRTIYGSFLKLILPAHIIIAHIFYVVIFALIYFSIKTTPIVLFPSEGIEIFFVRAECETGTPSYVMEEKLKKIEDILKTLPQSEMDDFVTFVGILQNDPGDPFTTRNSHVGQIAVYLTPEAGRTRLTKDIIEDIRKQTASFEGEFKRIWFDKINPGPPTGKPVALRVRGESLDTLNKIAQKIETQLQEIKGVKDIRNDYDQGKDEIVVAIKEKSAAQSRINASQIARVIRSSFEGEVATDIRKGDEDTHVIVRLSESDRKNPNIFDELYIQNPLSRMIPVKNLITRRQGPGINAIKHFDGKRTVSVTADIEEGETTSIEVNQAIEKPLADIMKDFTGYSVQFGGEYEDTQESLNSLMQAFILALFLIFIVLATSFNSLSQPFLIMLAIPFSLCSAMYALKMHGQPFSFLAMMGMIGLSGVSVNDSIVLIDFINQKVDQGKNMLDSVVEACKTRLRPVMLTSITTVVGLAPVAYGIGGSDPFLKPMALAMAWGLAFGTLLILVLIPNAYLCIKKYPLASIVALFTPFLGIGLIEYFIKQDRIPGLLIGVVALLLVFAIPYLTYLCVWGIKKIGRTFIKPAQ